MRSQKRSMASLASELLASSVEYENSARLRYDLVRASKSSVLRREQLEAGLGREAQKCGETARGHRE
jgi:hypothetical protein